MTATTDQNLSSVAETLFIPLYIRAMETQRPDALIKDEKAVELIARLSADDDFRRDMDFATEFRLLATKRMVTFCVTISAALMFRSYWALVIGMATGRIVGVVLSYAMQPFRPRFSLQCTRELFSFSGWLLVNNIASVVLSKVPHFFVGRAFGAQTLGAYTVGSEIAQLAHTELVAPINRAMFPGYSRLVIDCNRPIHVATAMPWHFECCETSPLLARGERESGCYRNAATRPACSRITRALSRSGVPATSTRTFISGLDQIGSRGQPLQLSL